VQHPLASIDKIDPIHVCLFFHSFMFVFLHVCFYLFKRSSGFCWKRNYFITHLWGLCLCLCLCLFVSNSFMFVLYFQLISFIHVYWLNHSFLYFWSFFCNSFMFVFIFQLYSCLFVFSIHIPLCFFTFIIWEARATAGDWGGDCIVCCCCCCCSW